MSVDSSSPPFPMVGNHNNTLCYTWPLQPFFALSWVPYETSPLDRPAAVVVDSTKAASDSALATAEAALALSLLAEEEEVLSDAVAPPRYRALVHHDPLPFHCPICQQSFTTLNRLESHLRHSKKLGHANYTPNHFIRCPHGCGYRARRQQLLRHHDCPFGKDFE